MKIIGLLTSLFVLLAGGAAVAERPFTLGPLTSAGSACKFTRFQTSLRGNNILIPGSTFVQLSPSEHLKRGSCQFAIPIQVSSGYRLRLTGLTAFEALNLSPQSSARTQIEIFKSGQRETPFIIQERSQYQRLAKRSWVGTAINILSDCGQGFILRGNSAMTLQSPGQARATLSNLRLRYSVESCR